MPEIFTAPSIPKKSPTPDTGTSSLSSFMVHPRRVRFQTQAASENVLLLMRKHPITNLSWILISIALILVPGFFLPLIVAANIIPQGVPAGYFLIIPLVWYLGTFGYAFTNFLHWYYNIYIVTNERIVDIDWVSLLYKRISSAQIDKIQDVNYKQGGILDSFFDFGTVYIQTAGTEPNFEFEDVPKPNVVVQEINELLKSKGVKRGI